MTTTFVLIRHASHDLLGNTLAGRTRDIGLNAAGQREIERLVERVAGLPLAAILTSPRARARATAAPVAARFGLEPHVDATIDEVDFGDWSGCSFVDLARDPHWSVWCNTRSVAQPPGGETIIGVQQRVVQRMNDLRKEHVGATIALVSHADVIKAALAHYLGIALDGLERFDVAPGSVSIVVTDDGWAQVKRVNDTGSL